MKFAKFALVVLLATINTGTRAQSAAGNKDEQFRHCQSFNECTVVWDGCSDRAINKMYEDQIKTSAACDSTTGHDSKALPTCEDGKCVVVNLKKGRDQ